MTLDLTKQISLTLTNAAAVYLLQLLGNQPVGAVTQAGQPMLYGDLAQQIQARNQPASVSPDIQKP